MFCHWGERTLFASQGLKNRIDLKGFSTHELCKLYKVWGFTGQRNDKFLICLFHGRYFDLSKYENKKVLWKGKSSSKIKIYIFHLNDWLFPDNTFFLVHTLMIWLTSDWCLARNFLQHPRFYTKNSAFPAFTGTEVSRFCLKLVVLIDEELISKKKQPRIFNRERLHRKSEDFFFKQNYRRYMQAL